MKTLRTIALMSVLVSMLLATAASAQNPTISVYFGQDKVSAITIPLRVASDIWVVIENMDDTINAVEYKLNLPAELAILSNSFYNNGLDFGSPASGVALGFGTCASLFQVSGNSEPLVVQHLEVFAFGFISMTPVTFSPFAGQDSPTQPRYSDCNGVVKNLDGISGEFAVTSVANDAESWGAVKALY